MKNIIIDLDNTITIPVKDVSYEDLLPDQGIVSKLKEYKNNGFKVTIFTARNMRRFDSNIGKINKHTVPDVINWLEKHKVPYDELVVGKPWCGYEGFYVDDRAVRPDEFKKLSYQEIVSLLK